MAFEERSGPFDLSNHWTTSPRVRLTANCLAGLEHDHAARWTRWKPSRLGPFLLSARLMLSPPRWSCQQMQP
ncbi:MAG: hypothetical protein Q9177_002143 [Variospora cf. flavescens]